MNKEIPIENLSTNLAGKICSTLSLDARGNSALSMENKLSLWPVVNPFFIRGTPNGLLMAISPSELKLIAFNTIVETNVITSTLILYDICD